MPIHDAKVRQLERTAIAIRKDVIEMLVTAGSGHTAGSLGMSDIFTALYFHILHQDPKKPQWEGRDRLILSNGHICPVLYASLAHAGYFQRKELKTLRTLHTRLQGHPHRGSLPGIENTSGPLGQGASVAVGVALAGQMRKQTYETFLLTSDGEIQEGQYWEAMMFAGNRPLHRLTVIVDRNNIQIDGNTETVAPIEPLAAKFAAFNFHVIEVDGHNIAQIVEACDEARAIYERPVVIIAHTFPGKGVDFMEGDYHWHGKAPSVEEARRALHQLRTLRGKVKSEHE
jgi:transketolase